MVKKSVDKILIVFTAFLFSSLSFSAFSEGTTGTPSSTSTPDTASVPTGIAKDEWIKKFKPLAAPAMCKSIFNRDTTKQIMDTHNISYDKCVTLIESSLNRCVAKIAPSLPTQVSNEDARKWGREIGICSGHDFYINNIAKKT